MLKFTPPDT